MSDAEQERTLPVEAQIVGMMLEKPSPVSEPIPPNRGLKLKKAKPLLRNKLQKILSCAVCLELRRSAIYQCKYGHLICAGCFGDILSESRLQNEIASCPVCQSTISKDLCFRNVAVEKTIRELPMSCPYCLVQISPESYKTHKKCLCEKRPTICSNNLIGCPWEGPYSQKEKHQDDCKQIAANGFEILKSLNRMDEESKDEVNLYEKIFELLSVEKFSYHDLQFKHCTVEDNVEFETSKFSAFDNLWVLRGNFKDKPSEFHYQLILKSKISAPLHMHYLLVKGPYSDMEIKPKLCQFTFEERVSEGPSETLNLWYHSDSLRSFFHAKRINIRIFIFVNI
ncbi:cysteine and histidine-rich protein 1 [Trichonephila inaurata madagascariensis]|uniref:Cysteine and histidine-rich protein 1 n=1 Tax=Trichonephila inaurata madagascariensis TaxID=2747483 RepID=A0A8X7CTQ8_9ARAC|nr:cysteine and histidine-rich protein 1 [Trichonephila inaurata madagascariensis]